MGIGKRLFRWALEVLAIALVVLSPAGCDISMAPEALDSTLAPGDAGDPQGPGGSDVNHGDGTASDDPNDATVEPPADDGADANDPSDDAQPQADDEAPANPGDDGPHPDDPEPVPDDPPADAPEDPPTDEPDDPPADPDVPDNEYCYDAADWSGEWAAFEEQVLELVNQHRAAGVDCDTQGVLAPTGPLAMQPELRCAARVHSLDMNVREFFSHLNPDGDGPGERLDYAGYTGFTWGENIAWGYSSPEAVVAGWMESDGHCANIMRPHFNLIGVGFYEGNFWTQTFGAE